VSVDECVAAFRIHARDSDRRVVGDEAQLKFALAESSFRALEAGDVGTAETNPTTLPSFHSGWKRRCNDRGSPVWVGASISNSTVLPARHSRT
jgi:hypothetical protein